MLLGYNTLTKSFRFYNDKQTNFFALSGWSAMKAENSKNGAITLFRM